MPQGLLKYCGTVGKWYWEVQSLLYDKDSVWQEEEEMDYGQRYPMIIKNPLLSTTGGKTKHNILAKFQFEQLQ